MGTGARRSLRYGRLQARVASFRRKDEALSIVLDRKTQPAGTETSRTAVNLRCSIHGLLPWLGHGWCVADGCQAIYVHILEAPKMCDCGEQLLPDAQNLVEALFAAQRSGRGDTLASELKGYRVQVDGFTKGSFSGRPLCAKCFESF